MKVLCFSFMSVRVCLTWCHLQMFLFAEDVDPRRQLIGGLSCLSFFLPFFFLFLFLTPSGYVQQMRVMRTVSVVYVVRIVPVCKGRFTIEAHASFGLTFHLQPCPPVQSEKQGVVPCFYGVDREPSWSRQTTDGGVTSR